MELKEIFLKILPLILIVNFFIIIFYYVDKYVEEKTLQESLIKIEPIFLSVNLILIIGSFLLNLKDIRHIFKPVKRVSWIILLCILITGFYLRMFIVPQTHRVYFDEDIYLDIGKEILTEKRACLCNYGDYKGCYDCLLMKWPNGYPFTVAVAFMFFGINETVAYNLEILLSSLSIALAFFIGYLFSNKEEVGLFSALLFALIPIHIIWSATTASEPIFIFYTLLAAFAFLLSFRKFDFKSSLFAMSSLTLALQVRAEGAVLLIFFGLMVLLLDKKLKLKLNDVKFLIPVVVLLTLILPTLIHVRHSSETDPWGATGKVFGFEHAEKNIPENAFFWIVGYPAIEHPILFTILAVIGFAYTLKMQPRVTIVLGVWFALIFFLYAFFYAGSVLYGTDVRYSISGYSPLVVFGGYGLYLIQSGLTRKLKHPWPVLILLSVLVFISFLFYLPSISTPADKIMEANQARVYHDFVVKGASKLDKNCYILSHTPSIFLVMDIGSLQTWYGSNTNVMKELFNKTDCVIFDDNFWCNLEPYKSSVCKHMFDAYNLTTLSSVETGDGHAYTLYKINNPF